MSNVMREVVLYIERGLREREGVREERGSEIKCMCYLGWGLNFNQINEVEGT